MMTNEDVKLSNEDNTLNKAESSAKNERVLRWNLRDRKSMQLSKAKQQHALTERSGKRKRENKDENNLPKLPNFSLKLKASEIAEDLFSLTGKLPSRRPNKRDKNVQYQIDLIFPGGYLDAITMDRYEVPKNSEKEN